MNSNSRKRSREDDDNGGSSRSRSSRFDDRHPVMSNNSRRPNLRPISGSNVTYPPNDPRHYGSAGVVGELEHEWDMLNARVNVLIRTRDFMRSLIEFS